MCFGVKSWLVTFRSEVRLLLGCDCDRGSFAVFLAVREV